VAVSKFQLKPSLFGELPTRLDTTTNTPYKKSYIHERYNITSTNFIFHLKVTSKALHCNGLAEEHHQLSRCGKDSE
jgi:hypothetical protein